LAIQPGNIAAANNLAYLMEEYLGKANEALKTLGSVPAQVFNNSDLLDTYGQIMMKLGRLEEALYYTARSVLIHDSATSRYHLGMILLAQNRRTEAAIQFRRAIQMVGEDKVLEKQIRDAMNKA
jgi:tetratricopeptide (TPR) repeat protein